MLKSSYYFLFLTLLVFKSFGQSTEDFKSLKEKYPTDGAVILNNFEELNIEVVKNALSIKCNIVQEKLLLDSRAGMFSEYSIDYSDFSKITEIKASTHVPLKNSYKEIKVQDFKTTDRLSTSVFYDDLKNVSFFYPSLIEGAKTSLNYTQQISHPQIIPGFYFEQHLPVLKSTYRIIAPTDLQLGWKIFNMADSLINFSKVVKKNKAIYTWEVTNLKPYRNEVNAPAHLYSLGHIIPWIKSYKAEGEEIRLLNNPNDLYNWYYSISKNCNKDESPELKTLVDSLVATCKNEPEKVRKIYYWVQDHIKYIAIEDGMSGYIPRSAKVVFEKRYGDCKDMASIITKMLSYANIPSHLTWIGSRQIPYTYDDIPTPQVDDHMIATYIHDGNYYFLDATANNIPFGFSNSFIQGKEALIGFDSAKMEIREVPVVPADKNITVDSVTVEIAGKKLVGQGTAYYSGYNKMYLSDRLKDHRTEKEKTLKVQLNKGSNKFQLESFDLANLEDRDKTLKIDYRFNVEDYINSTSEEIFLNLNLNRIFFLEEIMNSRNMDIEKTFKETQTSIIKVKIPDGFKASVIPASSSFDDKRFGFNIQYRSGKGYIILEHTNYYNFLMLKKDEFEDWNKYIKALKRAYSELIVFEKIK